MEFLKSKAFYLRWPDKCQELQRLRDEQRWTWLAIESHFPELKPAHGMSAYRIYTWMKSGLVPRKNIGDNFITFAMSDSLAQRLDAYAIEIGVNRSEAARRLLDEALVSHSKDSVRRGNAKQK